ncbi:hypothetical protein FKM82_025306 [Ascaphus truei]
MVICCIATSPIETASCCIAISSYVLAVFYNRRGVILIKVHVPIGNPYRPVTQSLAHYDGNVFSCLRIICLQIEIRGALKQLFSHLRHLHPVVALRKYNILHII